MNHAVKPFCSPGFNKGTGSTLCTLPLKSQRVVALIMELN